MRDVLRDAWEPLTDEMQTGNLGNFVGVKRGQGGEDPPRRVMLAAHMDEIGMMVTEVREGFLLVQRISGVDNRVMPAQPVVVHGREPLPGIVAATPPHLLSGSDRKNYPSWDSLMVDVGLPAERVEELVRPGDIVTVDAPLIDLGKHQVAGKALDDRACVAVMTVCLNHLQSLRHSWDIYAAATVQEEFGNYNGARTAAHEIDPDIAIALDVTFGKQPGVNGPDAVDVGGGPALSYGPNFHIRLYDAIQDTAKTLEMSLQDDVITGRSGTDAWGIQVARLGIPTALLNVPVRNMHSPVETVDMRDIERAGRLLAHFIAGLDADFLASIDWKTAAKNGE